MCGRVIQASGPLSLAIVDGLDVRDSRLTNAPRRYNGAPSQELLMIPPEPTDRGTVAGFPEVGLDPVLVQRSDEWTQAYQCES